MTVGRRTIGDVLEAARERLDRLTPDQARAEMAADAILIDIRCRELREDVGVVPGSIHHPLSVLYWRLDPTSGHADPRVADPNRRVILMCAHGYSSSLAAATLRDLGFERATDIDGGFEAWAAAGLPVEPALNPAASRASESARPDPSQR
jgi:rhodanese-related sulfurtransferase